MEKPTKLSITVKPGSKKGPMVVDEGDGRLTVYIRQRAINGQANKAAVELLASYFAVPKTQVQITHGLTSRSKRVAVSGSKT